MREWASEAGSTHEMAALGGREDEVSDEMTTTDGKSRRSAVEGKMGMLGIATGERRSEEMAIDKQGFLRGEDGLGAQGVERGVQERE